MQFLSDVFVPCPICEGKRFKPEILRISWNGRSPESAARFAERESRRHEVLWFELSIDRTRPQGEVVDVRATGGEELRVLFAKYPIAENAASHALTPWVAPNVRRRH